MERKKEKEIKENGKKCQALFISNAASQKKKR
jgi:hypothetical protein